MTKNPGAGGRSGGNKSKRRSARRIVRRGGKARGAPPGTIVHTGGERPHHVRVHWLEYGPEFSEEHEATTLDRPILSDPPAPVTWLDVDGVHDLSLIHDIGAGAALHPLVLEDIASVGQRAKLEDYGDSIYIVLRMLRFDTSRDEVDDEQVSIVLSPNVLISFQETSGDVFDPIRQRIREGKGNLRRRGTDYLAYSLMDAVIDGYFTVLEVLGERIDDIEQEVVAAPARDTVSRVHHLKRELLVTRRAVWPLRDVLNTLLRDETRCFTPDTRVFLRDAYDHTVQVMDTLETLRDILSSLMDIYLSSMSNRMNEVMKVLTIIATLFIPLTFLVGVYGMNFDWMPELRWRWGYPLLWLFMIGISLAMLAYFRRKGWL